MFSISFLHNYSVQEMAVKIASLRNDAMMGVVILSFSFMRILGEKGMGAVRETQLWRT